MSSAVAETPTSETEPQPGSEASTSQAAMMKLLVPIGITVSIALALASMIVWWISGSDDFSPGQRLELSLQLLDEQRNYEARELARKLEAEGFRDPHFDGAVEFILGVVAFRSAENLDPVTRRAQYMLAVSYLREAERRALLSERRPEWAFATGTSLFLVGLSSEAEPLLEEAIETYPAGRVSATLLLTDAYLDPGSRTPDVLQRALLLNDSVLTDQSIDEDEQARALLQRAQILLDLGQASEAEDTLAKIRSNESHKLSRILLQGRIRIHQQRFDEASRLLEPVANDARLNSEQSTKASYLLAQAAELAGNHESAVALYERTIERHENTDESLAANLHLGRLLQQAGRNEEALGAYGQALKQVRRPQDFQNDWISADQFRAISIAAWEDWVEQRHFMEAILLSELLSPLFTQDRSYELAAVAAENWADSLAVEIRELSFNKQRERRRELDARWIQAGEYYARLSHARRSSTRYEDAIWAAAQMYKRGHDFTNALELIDRFLKEGGEKRRPAALVERGEILLGLDRPEDATLAFNTVIETYPTDPVVFSARYSAGVSWQERDRPEQAAKVWRELIESDDLAPAAREWRLALFALGRILYHQAELAQREPADAAPQPETSGASVATSGNRLAEKLTEESVRMLNEYVERYPASQEIDEAEFLLAKGLQRVAESIGRRLESAETDNARRQLDRNRKQTLEESLTRLEGLRTRLLEGFQSGRLDDLQEEILRNCYYEIPHTLFALENYQPALTGYSAAANRFPLEPQSLMAYVQMANCYDRLGRTSESAGMLEQAKIILKQIPDSALEPPATNLTRAEWSDWLDWAAKLHQ